MLSTLSEKVDPNHCALVLVDVLNDFCAEGGAMHREGRDLSLVHKMIPRLEKLVDAARAANIRLVWIRCLYNNVPNHYLSDVWLEQAKRRRNGAYVEFPVCEDGEWNQDFYKVRPLPGEVVVTKHRYGAFEGTDLDLVLRSRGTKSVIITGVATNVCCETTARQAFMRDYYVVFTSDCNATYSQAQHDATLFNIDQFFGEVTSSEQIMACWPVSKAQLKAAS